MANKGNRLMIGLLCIECNSLNYMTERNRVNTPDKLKMDKYCSKCRKKTAHKETQKFK